MKKWKTDLMLLTTAVIWGLAFIAQKVGMDYVGPMTFIGIRFIIGGAVLLPVSAVMDAAGKRRGAVPVLWRDKTLIKGGILCGICLFAGSTFQQYALIESSVGKVGFITALYIVLVPVAGLFLGKKLNPAVWLAVAAAVAGLYFLCITEGFIVEKTDCLAIAGAVSFTFQIMVIDAFAPKTDAVKMSSIEFFTAGVLGCICMFIFEEPSPGNIAACTLPILYAGILSSGVAYTLQVVAQKYAQPAVASIIMSLESVFSALGGWLILHQVLSGRELLGCALMFAGALLAQLVPEKEQNGSVKRKEKRNAG